MPEEAPLRVSVQCQSCRARLLVVADSTGPGRPVMFAIYCSCGKRVPLAEPIGLIQSVTVAGGPVRIDRATVADAGAILHLQKLCYQSEAALYDDYRIAPLLQTIDQLTEEFASMVILKATDGDEVVGSVRARAAEGSCFVGRLIVHPKRQNQGIGRRLMAAIEQQFDSVHRFELFTGARSLKNLSLYSRLGYREFKREPQGDELTLVYMEKSRPSGE